MGYLFTIFSTIIYAFSIGICFFLFMEKNIKFLLYISILLTLFIIRTIIDDMCCHFIYFSNYYLHFLEFTTAISLLVYISICYLTPLLFSQIGNKKVSKYQFILPTLISFYMIFSLFYERNELLFFAPGAVYLMFMTLKLIKYSIKEYHSFYEKFYLNLGVFVLLGVLSISIEHYLLLQYSVVNHLSVLLLNRHHWVEDMFCLMLSLIVIRHCFYRKKSKLSNKEIKQFFINSFTMTPPLTAREKEVLYLLLDKKTNQEIADCLYISLGTVKTHTHNIFKKIALKNRKNLFKYYDSFFEEHIL